MKSKQLFAGHWVQTAPLSIPDALRPVLRKSQARAYKKLRGFVGFGCSFYGKFFGRFARDPSMNDFGWIARNNMLKLAPLIQDVEFRCESYLAYTGGVDVIYCDPPYAGATDYSSGAFDHAEFWSWVRSRKGTVIVSEYTAPPDFRVIWEKPVITTMKDRTSHGCSRVERLFTLDKS